MLPRLRYLDVQPTILPPQPVEACANQTVQQTASVSHENRIVITVYNIFFSVVKYVFNEYPAGRPTALLCTVRTGARRPFCPAAAVPTGGSVPGTINVVLISAFFSPEN